MPQIIIHDSDDVTNVLTNDKLPIKVQQGSKCTRDQKVVYCFVMLSWCIVFCKSLWNSKFILSYFKKPAKMIFLSKTSAFCLSVATLLSLTGSCLALRVNHVHVPHHQKSGDQVKLECNYDLEGDVLYSVKWYRGSHEFFRYVPGDNTPMQIFDLEGVVVNTALSDPTHVTLRSVSRKSNGKYKCEVSADAPSFHTASKSAEMLVVDLPESVPNITGNASKLHVGDEVHVNCSSKSRPASSLKWYINGKPVASERLVEYAPEKTENDLEVARLGLIFIVGAKDFPNGILKLKCTATTAAVYYQSSEATVEGQFPQTSPALESKGVYTGGCSLIFPQALSSAVIFLPTLFNLKNIANL